MKTMLSLFAVGAVLLTGCGTAAQASETVPNEPAPATAPDYLKPTGTAVPQCDPDECDPDEGEDIDPDELAELKAAGAVPDEGDTNTTVATATPVPLVKPVKLDPTKHKPYTPTTRPHYEEDDPQWDCYLDGNKICGPATEGLAYEGWEKFSPRVFTADELALPFRVTYMGTAREGVDLPPSEWYTIHSSKAKTDHVFKIEFGVTAP